MTCKEYDELIRSLMESDNNSLYAVKLRLAGMFRHGLLEQDFVTDQAFIESLLRLGLIDDPEATQKIINVQRDAYITGRQLGTRGSPRRWVDLARRLDTMGDQ